MSLVLLDQMTNLSDIILIADDSERLTRPKEINLRVLTFRKYALKT